MSLTLFDNSESAVNRKDLFETCPKLKTYCTNHQRYQTFSPCKTKHCMWNQHPSTAKPIQTHAACTVFPSMQQITALRVQCCFYQILKRVSYRSSPHPSPVKWQWRRAVKLCLRATVSSNIEDPPALFCLAHAVSLSLSLSSHWILLDTCDDVTQSIHFLLIMPKYIITSTNQPIQCYKE